MSGRDYLMVLGVVLAVPLAIGAELEGDFGYRLGDRLASEKILQTKVDAQRGIRYQVPSSDPRFEVWVRSNHQQVIHRITAYSQPLTAVECAQRLKQMNKDLEKNKPGLGSYALDDADMYYDDQRTLVLQCELAGKQKRLRIEYADDRLAEQ